MLESGVLESGVLESGVLESGVLERKSRNEALIGPRQDGAHESLDRVFHSSENGSADIGVSDVSFSDLGFPDIYSSTIGLSDIVATHCYGESRRCDADPVLASVGGYINQAVGGQEVHSALRMARRHW